MLSYIVLKTTCKKETTMAQYLIIADSSCELPEEYRNDARFSLVPFYINIEDNITKDLSIEEIAEITNQNAKAIFQLN